MTVFERTTISPICSPSGLTSRPSEWTTRSPMPGIGQPVQDCRAWRFSAGSDSVRKVRGVASVRIGEVSVRP